MTNHSETTGSFGNDDITGRDEHIGPNGRGGRIMPNSDSVRGERTPPADHAHPLTTGALGPHQVTLRTPAELADALPYLLGYRPEDSIVMVALHDADGRGRFGGRARLGIPANKEDWPGAAKQLAHGLITGSVRRGSPPEQMVVYLCQEPEKGETGRQVMDRLRPLAHDLRVECGNQDVPVIEALCVSGGRCWSYCCDREDCCPSEGRPMGLPGTSVLAAAATYAGLQVRGTLRELRARLQPWETSAALQQEIALDTAGMALVPRILDEEIRSAVAQETLDLARRVMCRLADAPSVQGAFAADLRDDELLGHDEAAALILGLQDRGTRDRAAEWMEGDEAGPALRLWRALARRCVGPYAEHAAAPLTLAGWVAWSSGDELESREALAMALGADPDYLFARLLHQACNEGLDPESLRRCLRAERGERENGGAERAHQGAEPESAGSGPVGATRDADALVSAEGDPGDDSRCEPSSPRPLSPAARRFRPGRARTVAADVRSDGTHQASSPGARRAGRGTARPDIPRPPRQSSRASRDGSPARRDASRPPRTSARDGGRHKGYDSSAAAWPEHDRARDDS
ncbi:DUF4192 family protein [Streptomyces sp. NPDC058739]|uniref:DUF4192 domain-containing protein n=1 Tax=Streptomyces sp. NPDC058739 TaxID=3346618 RepID=UPI0036A01BA7